MSSITIRLDGEPVEGRDGQTIAGILLASGRTSWREADGAPRGVFCGIGVCHDCLVTVNGAEGVRACQRSACDGDDVRQEVR